MVVERKIDKIPFTSRRPPPGDKINVVARTIAATTYAADITYIELLILDRGKYIIDPRPYAKNTHRDIPDMDQI